MVHLYSRHGPRVDDLVESPSHHDGTGHTGSRAVHTLYYTGGRLILVNKERMKNEPSISLIIPYNLTENKDYIYLQTV